MAGANAVTPEAKPYRGLARIAYYGLQNNVRRRAGETPASPDRACPLFIGPMSRASRVGSSDMLSQKFSQPSW